MAAYVDGIETGIQLASNAIDDVERDIEAIKPTADLRTLAEVLRGLRDMAVEAQRLVQRIEEVMTTLEEAIDTALTRESEEEDEEEDEDEEEEDEDEEEEEEKE